MENDDDTESEEVVESEEEKECEESEEKDECENGDLLFRMSDCCALKVLVYELKLLSCDRSVLELRSWAVAQVK